MPGRRVPAPVLLVVAAAILAVACSTATVDEAGLAPASSSEGSALGTPVPTAELPPPSRTDQEVVDEAVLTLDDVPAGWTAAPPAEEAAAEFDAPECGPIAARSTQLEETRTAEARSDDFTDPAGGLGVQENVGAVEVATTLAAFLDELADPALARACLDAILTASIRDQVAANPARPTLDEVSTVVTELAVPPVGDRRVGYQVRLELTVNGDAQTVYAEFVLVQVGRFGLTLSFVGSPSPFRPVDRDAVVETAVTRLEAARSGSGN